MMELPVELNKKIIEFLTSLPNVHDKKGRTALIMGAGLDKELETQIDYEGNPVNFFQLLIRTLTSYGDLEKDRRDALEAVLETTKQYIGQDRREHCDTLIQEWRKCRQKPTPSESANAKQSFVPRYKHDIFISYAPADEEWVSHFINSLKHQLAGLLDGKKVFLRKSDDKLSPDEMKETISQTAIFVMILSPSYLDSKRCDGERKVFLKNVDRTDQVDSRGFVVELKMIEESERPGEFSDFKRYQFWEEEKTGRTIRTLGKQKPNPDDPKDEDYYFQLKSFSCTLADRLKSLAGLLDVKEDTRSTIFLAEVSYDLSIRRERVSQYLQQEGFNVLPEIGHYFKYLKDPEAAQKSIDQDLTACQIFVQLLSSRSSGRPADWPSYNRFQFERANNADERIFQWSDYSLQPEAGEDEDQRELLRKDTIYRMYLEDFKKEIVKRTKILTDIYPGVAFVSLDTSKEDRMLAKELAKKIENTGVDCTLFSSEGKKTSDLADFFSVCNGVILVYGGVDVFWARKELAKCRRAIYRVEQPVLLAAYDGPPEHKPDLDMLIHGMRIFNCRKGLNERELQPFLETIKAGGFV